jgi:TPP-dependent pyruvate/acetoin dehydrogenase alpha subunit
MVGHAQHDAAEYVPRATLEEWQARDPIARYERRLTDNALWDAETKAALDARVERELAEDLAFAEASPFPLPETVAEGVYCDGCHTVAAEWRRPREPVTPSRESGGEAGREGKPPWPK